MLEAEIQKQVVQYLKAKNIFHFRTPNIPTKNRPNIVLKGTPDLIAIIKGQFIGLEIKTQSGKQSDHQKEFETKLMKAGGRYYIIRSLQDLIENLKGLL